jgi:hypothetical protein
MSQPSVTAPQVSVSGTILLDQMALLRETYSAAVVDQAMAALPATLRGELESMLRGSWCSVEAAMELKRGIAKLVHEDPLALQRRIVRLGVERTLNTIWRFFMRRLGDEQIARRTPVLYSRTFNHGSMSFLGRRPNGVDLELRGWPNIPHFDLVGLMAGIETVFTLAGRKATHVESVHRGDTIIVHVSWKP